jgi:Ni/Co efflux regulator RcnB
MRKLLFSLLLATTAASPVFAQQNSDNDKPRHSRSDRSEARSERSDARAERSEARSERPVVRVEREIVARERGTAASRADVPVRQRSVDRVRPAETLRQFDRQRTTATRVDRQAREDLRQQRNERLQESRDSFRDTADSARRRTPPAGARPDLPAPPPTTAHQPAPTWHTDWRHNYRYDWYNYRNLHRSLFRLGLYFDPFGWGYHRWNIGWRLWPSYYSSSYWLDDPWMYRLPYAPWPYKWVRYYDDALLVNVYSGQVADVIYDFFW